MEVYGSSSRVSGSKLRHQQFRALLRKNFLLCVRRKLPTFLHLASSFFFISLISSVNRSITSRLRSSSPSFAPLSNPPPSPVPPIPPCESGFFIKSPCYDFIWTPNSSSPILSVVLAIMHNNPGRPIPSDKVLGFETISAAEEWLLQNPLRCTGALHMEERSPSIIAYGIQTNSSIKSERGNYEDPVFKFQIPLQLAAEREITRFIAGDASIEWAVSFKEFAHPSVDVPSMVGAIAPTFLLAASMFGFVIQISNLVSERQLKLRQAMCIMGLLDSAYWLSWTVWDLFLALVSSLLLVLFGMMFGFYLFTHNGFGVLLCLFFTFEVNMIGYAYMLSAFINKSSSAKTVGFCVFIIGFLTQLVTYFGFPYNNSFAKSFQVMWSFFPPNLLAIALFYLSHATANRQDPGISWADFRKCSFSQPDCVLTMENIFVWLVATFFLWLSLAIYIDNVFPDMNRAPKCYLYFLQKSYWTGNSKNESEDHRICDCLHALSQLPEKGSKDVDVKAEEDLVKRAKNENFNDPSIAVQVLGLVKAFTKTTSKNLFSKARRSSHAVKVIIVDRSSVVSLRDCGLTLRKISCFVSLVRMALGKPQQSAA